MEASERLANPDLRTVAGAARHLGIGKSTLYHYEDGTKRPSLEALEQIAEGYGLMVGDLLPSKSIRAGEIAPVLAPLMAIQQAQRAMFVRQMASFAESLAGAIHQVSAEATATATASLAAAPTIDGDANENDP